MAEPRDQAPRSERNDARGYIEESDLGATTLEAAVLVKRAAGQVSVLLHALAILNALPYILEPRRSRREPLARAGYSGRKHDLETDRRVAEFKFITWRRGPESIRQNGVFADLFNLASTSPGPSIHSASSGAGGPLRAAEDAALAWRFRAAHRDCFATVHDYYATVRDHVSIVDLVGLVPGLTAD